MKKLVRLFCVQLLVMVMFAVSCHAKDYVAMVMEIQNGPVKYAAGEKAGNDVAAMDFLNQGMELTLPEKCKVVLHYFTSASREVLEGPLQIKVTQDKSVGIGKGGALEKTKMEYIPSKLGLKKVHSQNFGSFRMRSIMPMQTAKELKPRTMHKTHVRPRGTVEFSWRALQGASMYTVYILDDFDKNILTKTVKEPSLSVDMATLTPGMAYFWTVQAQVDNQKIMRPKKNIFTVLKESYAQEVNQAQSRIQSISKSNSTEALTSLALLYQDYNLKDEMRHVLKQLHEKDPNNKNYIKLLKTLSK